LDAFKFVAKIAVMLVVPAAVGVTTYQYLNDMITVPVNAEAKEQVPVIVAPTDTFSNVCSKIAEAGIVKAPWVLNVLQRLRAKDLAVKAGEYSFNAAMKPVDVLEKLKKADIVIREFTLNEGDSIWALPARIEEAGITDAQSITAMLTDRDSLATAGVRADSFEGYLGAGTYRHNKGDSPRDIVLHLFNAGKELWHESYDPLAQAKNLSRHEIMTMASLIQSETTDPAEQAQVSQIYHKALGSLKKLKSNRSVLYGLSPEEAAGGLKEQYFRKPHPYNTYINFGLPPGPVCNPSNSAIVAALYPDDTVEAEFFLKDPVTGVIKFYKDEAEYNKAFEAFKRTLLSPEELAAIQAEKEKAEAAALARQGQNKALNKAPAAAGKK
jgi:UPF0755 protein